MESRHIDMQEDRGTLHTGGARAPGLKERDQAAEKHALVMLETVPDGFIGLNEEWRFTYLNAAAERMLGCRREQLLDKDFWDQFNSAISPELEKRCRSVMDEKTPAEFHGYFVPPDSYYQILISHCEEGILIFLRDITEQKRLREALEENEAWRRLIIQNVKEFSIFSTDLQGRVTLWNPGSEKVFGYTSAEMIDQPCDLIFTPEDRAGHAPEQERTEAAKNGHSLDERWHLRKDGSRFFGSGALVPLFDEDHKLRGFTKVVRDITERKRLEDELRTARDHLEGTVEERTAQLRETISELEAFSYSLSHDMRTPLRAMKSFSEVLATTLADKVDPQSADYLERIVTAANRLDHLIQDVLSYSRMSRSQIQLETVDVSRLVTEIIREHTPLNPANADIQVVEPLLPVIGHEASLSQCISNLLTNGVKFVAPGTRPRLRIWTELVDAHVRLWVEDNGIGIAREDQERIFGMFQRLGDDSAYDGTGIGLAIVRKAVERMGGKVGVESELGKGSKFWLQLPKGYTA